MRKKGWVIFCFIFLVALRAQAFGDPADKTAQEKPVLVTDDNVAFYVCQEKKIGVQFYCSRDWKVQEKENQLFITISSKPAFTLTISVAEAPVSSPQQLTDADLIKMGHYADGFDTGPVLINGEQAFEADGFSKEHPETMLSGYYFIHKAKLYTVLFSFAPKKQWPAYRASVDRIIKSFKFSEE